ncbi:MAG: 30S ribosomal protein S9 [Hadesarchaea archaeon YNP_N21]|jgi:small subunit ribosomal protein S9|nr:MAG: 30S ribosomal protein S9 [Hadesarchaea archaeon YNP_N21]
MKTIVEVGRRKAAIARATIKEGKGRVFINDRLLDNYEPELARLKILEPLRLIPDIAKRVDVEVKVEGGGVMGQADAARTAIARGLLEWTGDPKVREIFKQYDWSLIKSDVRFKEPKKFGGPGARARFQKSYR